LVGNRLFRFFYTKWRTRLDNSSIIKFSLVFSLIVYLGSRNTLNKLFHTFRALLLHVSRNMSIHIQGKCCCCMSQILLKRFDVIPALEGSYCIGMSKIMESRSRRADLCYNALEAIIYRPIG
jgi:hypothetical protein